MGVKQIRKQFDCILVDEYQDTNVLQAEILQQLCPDGTGLTVVGDDAQSIYSFRAANVRNILDFPQHYPGTEVVLLEENYRSTQPILEAANRVIQEAPERHHKELWTSRNAGQRPQVVSCMDEDEQAEFVIRQVLWHREKGVALQQQAVLFRASHHSLSLELLLTEQNIPFHKYGGLKFVEASHIKDLLGFLRLAENPFDMVSAMRILMLLPGIGRKRALGLADQLVESGGAIEVWENWNPPQATREHWPAFVALLTQLSGQRAGKRSGIEVPAEIDLIRSFYGPLMEQHYSNHKERMNDLTQLVHVSARYPSRTDFLTAITLDPPSSTQDLAGDPHLDEDFLVLSTMHSAKGLEWDAVYVLHAADGNIPSDIATKSDYEVEEERRLFYVALSRAKDFLYVCHPQRYYRGGRARSGDPHSFSQLTRFLTVEARAAFDWRLPDQEEPVSTAPGTPVTGPPVNPVTNAHAQSRSLWE